MPSEKAPSGEEKRLEVVVGAIRVQRLILSLVMILISIQSAFAEMMQKGKSRVKTLLNVYSQNSKSGKQVLDNSGNENLLVLEPQIFVKYQITEDTEINASFVLDTWTAESDTILDGNTGASGSGRKGQSRVASTLGGRKEIGKSTYGVNLGFSSEYDYTSKNISFDVDRSFAEDNFTIGLGLQYYADTVGLFKDITPPQSAVMNKQLSRDIYALNLSASQILTRADLAVLGVTYAKSSGRLESTAGSVQVGGVREVEILPGDRERKAVSAKWVHSLSETTAFNLAHRYYFDNWGLEAHSVRGAFLVSLRDDLDFLELGLRYHTQGSVDYYKDRFVSSERFMTSDSDLSKFHSYEPSILYSRNLGELKAYVVEFQEIEWSNSLTYSKRNTGLQSFYVQTGLSFFF